MEITLTQAIFGMGNQNHDHVHRHNTLNLDTMNIDTLKMEQMNGGVTPSTLNSIANQSGGISSRPQGYVMVEDGWNIRRGIGMLRFVVESNALSSSELSVLGYLTGGGASPEGIEPQTMFVPVRSWTTSTRNVPDNIGLPMTKTVVSSSTQFLLGDPNQMGDLKAIRPLDVGNEVLGYMACEQDGLNGSYDGILGADLSKNVVVSKTDNLNPTHHAKELLRIATQATLGAETSGIENVIADALMTPGIGEMSITENEFFRAMMIGHGHHNLAGFGGWSVQEIAQIFQNLPDVLDLQLLNPSSFGAVDNLMGSHEYGGTNMFEIVASELAMMTVHLLMRCGLIHLRFSATNNPHDVGGLTGSDDGIEIVVGEFGSVLNHDNYAINRVEQFKQLLKTHFFSKYSTGYVHTSTILSVEVCCSIFGETSVTLFFNGEADKARNFVNATYCINRTSSNISGSAVGLEEAKSFMNNIKDYFI